MRLFIADDNIEFAAFCAKVARGEGWTVTICKDGIELLDALLGEDTPALILCDVNMPRLDGFEAIPSLRVANRHHLVRFMTGGVPINAKAATMLGQEHGLTVRDYLLKPITIADLRAILRSDMGLLSAK